MQNMKQLTNKKNILQLVALMNGYGIRDVVVCPGSRNAPIVHTLAETGLFRCHAITDERSAGFVAIGIADATNNSVAVCCTSGSAVLNIAPAVAEAYYRNVPLLVVSADRPKEIIGQMDGQTMVQTECFGYLAKTYNISETDTDIYRNRLINEALASLNLDHGKPIHINVQIDEPLFNFDCPDLPKERIIEWELIKHNELSTSALKEWQNARKKMFVIGQMPDNEAREISAEIERLTTYSDVVVVAEHLANLHNANIIKHFDDILANADKAATDKLAPNLVVYIGGHIVSKRLKQFLRSHPHKCWHITDSESVIDLFHSTVRMVKAKPDLFLSKLKNKSTQSDFAHIWHKYADTLPKTNCTDYIQQSIVGQIINRMPDNSVLALANSSSVRYAQHFDLPKDTITICNRGINGIEGSLSAAVGFAMATNKLTIVITGDLSFFYDSNALWNNALPNNLRIVLINDGCGSIFSSLNGLEQSAHRDKLIAGAHTTSAENLCKAFGCKYLQATNKEEADKVLEHFYEPSERPIIIEFAFDAIRRQ